MKYKLTKEFIEMAGKRLFRIEALIDIPKWGVKKGDLGGYIEKEENLSQYGNAWVYGDARVFSDARVYGDAEVSSSKDYLFLNLEGYSITIVKEYIQIGCKYFPLEDAKDLKRLRAGTMKKMKPLKEISLLF